MKYNYRTGATKAKRKNPIVFMVISLLFVGGAYVGLTALGAAVPSSITGESNVVAKALTERQPDIKENKLYVPKIGVDVSVVEGVTESSLEGGAWHRAPQNGDPVSGGNFVLAAHRFNLGLTPTQTRAKSPFYHIDKLQPGDDIYVDYKGLRYAYKVSKLYKVASNQTEIEARTEGSKLTMYSCNLAGPEEGREVVEADPVGTIAWLNGEPKLKSIQ